MSATVTTKSGAYSEGYSLAMFGNDYADMFSCTYEFGSDAQKQWQDGYMQGARDWR